jgi:hypothetical protein
MNVHVAKYSPETWKEMIDHHNKTGIYLCGYKEAKEISKGDYIIGYIWRGEKAPNKSQKKMISRFVYVARAASETYEDTTRIWKNSVYPYRVKLDMLFIVNAAEEGVLYGTANIGFTTSLDFVNDAKGRSKDRRYISMAMRNKTNIGIADAKKIADALGYKGEIGEESISEPSLVETTEAQSFPIQQLEPVDQVSEREISRHNDLIDKLLKIGSSLGYKVYSPNRSAKSGGIRYIPITGASDDLVKDIDVIWYEDDLPYVVWEVETTTGVKGAINRFNAFSGRLMPALFYVVTNDDSKYTRWRQALHPDRRNKCFKIGEEVIDKYYDAMSTDLCRVKTHLMDYDRSK